MPKKPKDNPLIDEGTEEVVDNDVASETPEQKSPTGFAPTKDTWKHRRRMAYIALFSQVLATAGLFTIIPIERIEVLQEITSWFYFSFSSIVGAYVGFATWASFKGK